MNNINKINKFKLFHIKKEQKIHSLSHRKKSNERILREREENIVLSKYKQLKHQIFEQEKKDKGISKEQDINRYTLDFNYSNLMKIFQKYISSYNNKSEDNPFNYDVKKGKLMLENQNRNIRLNRINEYLKKIVLKFQKVNSKLETGINNKKLFFSEEMAEKLKNKIEAHRKKIYNRNSKLNTNSNNVVYLNSRSKCKTINNSSNTRNLNIMNNNKKRHKIEISKYNEIITNNSNSNYNLKLSSFNSPTNKHIKFRKNKRKSTFFNLTNAREVKPKKENNLKYELINNKKTSIDSYKKCKINIDINNMKNKNLLSNSSNLTHYSSLSLKGKKEKLGKANTIEPSEKLIDDYNTIGLMKKYNKYYIKKHYANNNLSNRPLSCKITKNKNKGNSDETSTYNQNLNRNSSLVKKNTCLKVRNHPICTSNIKDFISEYNRIKRNIKKLNKNYKEKHFSTYKKIDQILEIKEDMQMFLLKQKFLHSKFQPKQIKLENHKNDFISKIKENLEVFEEQPRCYEYSNLEDLKI